MGKRRAAIHTGLMCSTAMIALSLAASCGATPTTALLPTADIRLASPAPVRFQPIVALPAKNTAIPQPSSPAVSATPASYATPLEQYRAWMDQARAAHPYPDPIEVMWEVMICESSGDPQAITGANQGLFQYDSATWAGDWNPYRDQPILDPRAQIFATAKAWADGNQHWWSCYHG